MTKIKNEELGSTLAQLRQKAGFTQVALADKIKISQPAIAAYEAGKTYPALKTLKKSLKLFKVDAKIITRLKSPRYFREVWIDLNSN